MPPARISPNALVNYYPEEADDGSLRVTSIGEGCVIMPWCYVGRGVTIGKRVLLEAGAIVDDFAILEDESIVRTAARVGTGAIIGARGEVNYDTELTPGGKVEPRHVYYGRGDSVMIPPPIQDSPS